MSSKLELDVCYHVVPSGECSIEVTAGLVESNGSLLLGGWLKVTCGLTACTPVSACSPMLGNEYGNFTFLV